MKERKVCFKKGNLSIFLLLIIVVFVIGGSISLVETASYALMQKNAEVYGDFHGIIFAISENAMETVEQSPYVTDHAYIYSYGIYELPESQVEISLGTYDEKAWEMSHIQLIEGRMPQSAEEIALEERWKTDMGWKTGDTVTIDTGEEEKQFTICGWINNYRLLWARSQPGVLNKQLPTGLLGKDALPLKMRHVMLDFVRTNRTDSSENIFHSLTFSLEVDRYLSQASYYNSAVYTNGGGSRFYEFRMTTMAVLVIASLVAIYGVLMRRIREYRLQDISAKQLLLSVGGAIFGGALTGLLMHQLLSPLCKSLLGYEIPLFGSWWIALVLAVCSFGLTILEYRRQQSRKMLTELLGRHIPKDAKTLGESRWRRSRRTTLAVCAVVALLAMLLSGQTLHLEVNDYGLNWEAPVVTAGEFPEIPRFDINMHYGLGDEIMIILQVLRVVTFLFAAILSMIGVYHIYMEYVHQDAHAFRALCDRSASLRMLRKELLRFLLLGTVCAVVLCRIMVVLTSGGGIPHFMQELLYALPGIAVAFVIGAGFLMWTAHRANKYIWKE